MVDRGWTAGSGKVAAAWEAVIHDDGPSQTRTQEWQRFSKPCRSSGETRRSARTLARVIVRSRKVTHLTSAHSDHRH